MSLSSLEFLYIFLPLFCGAYCLMPPRGRNALLLLGSIGFYVLGSLSAPGAIALMAFSCLVNWLLGIALEEGGRARKAWLAVGIVCNIGTLFFFKYLRAVSEPAFEALGSVGFSAVALPLGLSFYSFRAMSYLADVYRARCLAERRPDRFCLWLLFFPTVLQGPLTRYRDMLPALKERKILLPAFVSGLRTFLLGLGFKVLLADRLFRLWQKVEEFGWNTVSSTLAWICVVAYSLYLYFDFAGYSLMAVGVGRMLGFELPENFRAPYAAKSMTEFWRRWHITLGAWFREYIYIPLGGNRRGVLRTYCNLLCVWLFTGIWHGSSWNFVVWGLFLFAVVALEKAFLKKHLDKSRVWGHLYMAVLIPVSWAIFSTTDFSALGKLMYALVPWSTVGNGYISQIDFLPYLRDYWIYLVSGLVLCTGLPEKLHKKWEGKLLWDVALAAVFCLSVYFIVKTGADPFAYGNF